MNPGPRFLLLVACFVLSGLAGLIYQTAWTQQLAVVFGTSELALVTVLAAYMAGLALGASAAGRWAHRVTRPVLAYAALELGVGVAALLVGPAIGVANRLQVALLGSHELPGTATSMASGLFYLASSFAILIVPTALMGATLPLLARHAVRRDEQIGPRIGVLYTANTLGAAGGTLIAAFVLLPRVGLDTTVLIAAGVNLLVFALAALLARGVSRHRAPPIAEADRAPERPRGAHWVLPLILLSGTVSFTWEILWTRLLAYPLGGSVYAFATMLATFLFGLALGSGLAARAATTRARAEAWFAAAQIAIAGLSLAAFAALDHLPELAQQLIGAGDAAGPALCAATLLPGAVAIGATFPLAVRILAKGAGDAASAAARVFAWNTAGAIAGAVAAGYLVLPALRFAGTAAAAAALSLALALIAALCARPRRRTAAAVAAAGLLTLAAVRPPTPWRTLRHSPIGDRELPGEVAYYGVGRSATVLLLEQPAAWRLTTNGLPESSIDAAWARPGRFIVARWLSLLALAARPETRSLLVVGLGAGVTVEDVPSSVEEIHVVELEPEVVRANRHVAYRRHRDPLADPRLELHLGDARGALRLTGRRFDAVVSQPSHPWTSGAAHLFTREFFTQVRERLTPGGVFVQWMGLAFIDDPLLRTLIATVTEAFPHVELYQPHGGSLLVLASDRPLTLAETAPAALATAHRQWLEIGVRHPRDIHAARVLDNAGARTLAQAADGVSTDARNLFRMRSPRALENPLGAAGAARMLAPYEPIPADLPAGEAVAYVRRLLRQGSPLRARWLAEAMSDLVTRQTAVGWVELAAGRRLPAQRALRQALRLASRSEETLAALLLLHRPEIARGQPLPFASRVSGDPAAGDPAAGDPAAVVVAAWRLAGAGDWTGLGGLEERLAGVDVEHPLSDTAVRLRASWRVASEDPRLAHEALALIAPLLVPLPQSEDLLLRARAAAATGEPRVALAAMAEALATPRAAGQRAASLTRQARRILASLPVDAATDDWRRQLLTQLDRRQP